MPLLDSQRRAQRHSWLVRCSTSRVEIDTERAAARRSPRSRRVSHRCSHRYTTACGSRRRWLSSALGSRSDRPLRCRCVRGAQRRARDRCPQRDGRIVARRAATRAASRNATRAHGARRGTLDGDGRSRVDSMRGCFHSRRWESADLRRSLAILLLAVASFATLVPALPRCSIAPMQVLRQASDAVRQSPPPATWPTTRRYTLRYLFADCSHPKSRVIAARIISNQPSGSSNWSIARVDGAREIRRRVVVEQESGHAVFDRVGEPADAPRDRESSRSAARASASGRTARTATA